MKRSTADGPSLPPGWLTFLEAKIRPPVCIILGSPRQAVALVEALKVAHPVLFQMDQHQADRVEQQLRDKNLKATVSTHADLWDLPADFQTAIYPVEPTGERMLKLDMVEQAYHMFAPRGTLIVVSQHDNDQFFPSALKKIFGRCHIPDTEAATVLWCQRDGERPRRRHEITFQVANPAGPSFRFLSRPGTFSYGRFDHGARALVEMADIHPGDSILDLGCGCGTNGVICGLRAGPDGHVTFVDSNCRATALAEANAAANGLSHFDVQTCFRLDALAQRRFDVILANPPYFANHDIAQRFIEQARPLLKQEGRFYLVTKQPDTVGPMVAEAFGPTQAMERRGYVVLSATA